MTTDDPWRDLRPNATVRQLEIIEAIEEHGSMRAAARALGVSNATLHSAINGLKQRSARLAGIQAAREGHAPGHFDSGVAPGFRMGKVTVQRDRSGGVERTWERQSPDQARQAEAMRETIIALSEEVRGLSPLGPAPQRTLSDLLAVYPMGDPHIGMYSWAQETGADFDLAIAERLTLGAVTRLVETAPAAETGIILPLGDTFHMNDQTNATPAHKYQLDVDSRFVKVLHVGIKMFRHAILCALQKHARVVVRFVGGNHDPQAIWALAFTIAAYFDNEPRVTVDLSPAAHWYYRHGLVLLGATHGDKSKSPQLPGVMACDRARDWGETQYRYWLCGHVHHSSVQEYPGVIVETFRTLAAPDSYAAGYGYRAGRDMHLIVYCAQRGAIERHRCDVAMLEN